MLNTIPSVSRTGHGGEGASDGVERDEGNLLKAVILRAKDRLIEVHAHSASVIPPLIARLEAARSARVYVKQCDTLLANEANDGGGQGQLLPAALGEFATRHELISKRAASTPIDAAGLRALQADLESMSFGASASTQDQVEVKKLLMLYETTLSLANATQTRLRETLKTIAQNL